jgi:hypothetical protein
MSRSRIFHFVTIADEGLQNLGLCWALKAFEQVEIFIVPHLLWHGTSVFRSHPPLTTHMRMWRIYSNPDPYDLLLLVPYRYNRRGLYTCMYRFCTRLFGRLSTKFYGPFSVMCAVIALKLCIWLYIHDLQIKFEDCCFRPIFGRVMSLELSQIKGFYSFPHFFSLCLKIIIWYLVHCLSYQDTDQVWVWFRSIDFFRRYGLWTFMNDQFSAFFLSAYRYSFDI